MLRSVKKITRRVYNWEHWPFAIFYFPLSFWWVAYWFKSRSVWYFSACNPSLTFGGFEGETKEEMYSQLPDSYFPPTIYINPDLAFSTVLDKLKKNNFCYPFAAKPNKGAEGILFRKIKNEKQLEEYHHKAGVSYILQTFVNYPVELGIFYCRHPSTNKGQITAVVQKYLPGVTGDGHSSVRTLIQSLKLSPALKENLEKENFANLNIIIPKNEYYQLSYIANRYHGSKFINITSFNRGKLLRLFDQISLYSNSFFYGRYDLKCQSLTDLENGKNFYILEFNGAGSIPNQIYTADFTLLEAYREILKHWKILYEISSYNHNQRVHYLSFMQGLKILLQTKNHFRRLKKIDHKLKYL